MAGQNLWPAIGGFLVTGVGLPLLGVVALGVSREEGLLELSSRVGRGVRAVLHHPFVPDHRPLFRHSPLRHGLLHGGGAAAFAGRRTPGRAGRVFAGVFCGGCCFFSLRPGEILTWIGKVLNPLFLAFLAVLVVRALAAPLGRAADIAPHRRLRAGGLRHRPAGGLQHDGRAGRGWPSASLWSTPSAGWGCRNPARWPAAPCGPGCSARC